MGAKTDLRTVQMFFQTITKFKALYKQMLFMTQTLNKKNLKYYVKNYLIPKNN